jgi:hypothetical protein
VSRDRRRLQLALRVAGLVFVVAWLFSWRLQRLVPFWVPFAVLLAAEAEFLLRGVRERRVEQPPAAPEAMAERRAPGADDADLGWGDLVEDEDGLRYVPPPLRAPRRRSRRLLAVAAIGLGIALFVAAVRVDRSRSWQALAPETQARVEARLTREASAIAGKPVTVRCDDGYSYTGIGSDALGVAFIDRGLAFLQPSVCRTLHDLVEGDRREREATGEAILVLAHEAVHLAGERDEGVTECKGLQLGVPLGERLGLPRDRAETLMASLRQRSLAERSITRTAYRLPPECRDEGALDLRPQDSTFP